MLKLHSASDRNGLKEVLNVVNVEFVIASPYINTAEAEWVWDELERRQPAAAVRLQALRGDLQVLIPVIIEDALGARGVERAGMATWRT